MPLSLVIFDNPTPEEARALLATHDPTIIAAVRRLLLQRLGEEPGARVLPLQPRQAPPKGRGRPPVEGRE
jgi:hypothetical protein